MPVDVISPFLDTILPRESAASLPGGTKTWLGTLNAVGFAASLLTGILLILGILHNRKIKRGKITAANWLVFNEALFAAYCALIAGSACLVQVLINFQAMQWAPDLTRPLRNELGFGLFMLVIGLLVFLYDRRVKRDVRLAVRKLLGES